MSFDIFDNKTCIMSPLSINVQSVALQVDVSNLLKLGKGSEILTPFRLMSVVGLHRASENTPENPPGVSSFGPPKISGHPGSTQSKIAPKLGQRYQSQIGPVVTLR